MTQSKVSIPYLKNDKTMADLDTRGKGEISIGVVRQAAHTIRRLNRIVIVLVLLVLLLLVGMFVASWCAIQVTKDLHVERGLIVDDAHRGISTLQKLDSVSGVQTNTNRRLQNSTSQENDSDLSISSRFFYDTVEEYTNGKSAWVVPLPDGTVRTIAIQGASAQTAWGTCGTCQFSLVWNVNCAIVDTADQCPIDWKAINAPALAETGRLLRGNSPEMPLEARARESKADSFSENVERSLTSKSCI